LTQEVRRDPGRIRHLLTGTVSGLATACLWLQHEGRPLPVLVYDRGTEIHEHLLEWAENDPSAWFTLHFSELPEDPPGYVVVLQPRLDRSLERFKQAFPPDLLEGVTVEVVFSPLYLVAGGTSYQRLKYRIGTTSSLGLLDSGDFDPQQPGACDPGKIRPLGPFAVGDMADLGGVETFLQSAARLPR
jgi:hypothetical protein